MPRLGLELRAPKRIAAWWQRRMLQWLARRQPPQSVQRLDRHTIFIFPSAAGFAFLFLAILLWLVATNYENNLVFFLLCLLVSLFVIAILHTFANLSGISLSLVKSEAAFVGEDACVEILLQRHDRRRHENLLLGWPGVAPIILSLIEHDQQACKVYVPATRRGWFDPGRLLLQSYYPLGLLRAWSKPDLALKLLVYPKPINPGPLPLTTALGDGEDERVGGQGNEEFYGFHPYQAGEPLAHVAWKQYARTRQLYSKEYSGTADRRLWLDWDNLPGRDLETRLSGLCYWVLEAAKGQEDYGLRLPGVVIPPARGDLHKHRLLEALAFFPAPPRGAAP